MITKSLKWTLICAALGLFFICWIGRKAITTQGAQHYDLRNTADVSDRLKPPLSQATAKDKPAEEVFQNIQVFKGLPSSQLYQAMFYMRGALGVTCSHCHVNFTDFEKDDNRNKQITRQMIQMERELNQNKFGGAQAITCNTCHRGEAKPAAPLAFAPLKEQGVNAGVPIGKSQPALSVDEIFERYVAATGSKVAHQKLVNFVITGSMLSSEGWKAPLKIYLSAPNKWLVTFKIDWVSYRGFDGKTGWSQDNSGLHDLSSKTLALFKRERALFGATSLKDQYTDLGFVGKEMIDGRLSYVISGVLAGAGPERLYFDVDTGFLVRITSESETALGALPGQINLKDYREVNGIKLPFTIERLAPDFSSAYKIASVENNVPVDESRYGKPKSPLE